MEENIFKPGEDKAQIEEALKILPDKIADALEWWRIKTLEREKVEALLYAEFRSDKDRTSTEIKALINADQGRYDAVLKEIKAEAHYNRLNERLMAAKKLAALRTAF